MAQINVRTANKQMHDKHKDPPPTAPPPQPKRPLHPKQGDQNAKRTEETHRQRAGQDHT